MLNFRLLLSLLAAPIVLSATPQGTFSRPSSHFNIGLVLPIHNPNATLKVPYDTRYACGELNDAQMLSANFFINMIDAINARQDLLPNITLGFSIVDSCSLPNVAISRVAAWGTYKRLEAMAGGPGNVVNTTNEDQLPITFAVGGYNSRVSLPLTMYLQLYDIPLIDHGATLGDLSDRRRYSLYARTTASDKHQSLALVDVIKELGHNCIHLIYSEGLYGELGADDIRLALASQKMCTATDQIAPTLITSQSSDKFQQIVENMKQNSSARVVLCFCEDSTLQALIAAINRDIAASSKMSDDEKVRFILVGGDYWTRQFPIEGFEKAVQGAVTTLVGLPPNATTGLVFDAEMLMQVINETREADINPWLVEFYEKYFDCSFTDPSAYPCDLDEMVLANDDLPVDDGAELLYVAIMAGVQGLHSYLRQVCPTGDLSRPECLNTVKASTADKLYNQIVAQQVDVSDFGHPPFKFDADGDGLPRYSFMNLQEVTVLDEDTGYISQEMRYETMAVWEAGQKMQVISEVKAQAKLWPGTNETITSTCNCPA